MNRTISALSALLRVLPLRVRFPLTFSTALAALKSTVPPVKSAAPPLTVTTPVPRLKVPVEVSPVLKVTVPLPPVMVPLLVAAPVTVIALAAAEASSVPPAFTVKYPFMVSEYPLTLILPVVIVTYPKSVVSSTVMFPFKVTEAPASLMISTPIVRSATSMSTLAASLILAMSFSLSVPG
ncbi:hypothetical protein ES705_44672 [subsurface metagenome]